MMPPNNGTRPRCDLVHLRFRNGEVMRAQDPKKWNFAPLVHNGRKLESPFDITHYQEVK